MILAIDLSNERLAFGAIDGRGGRWLSASPSRGCHGPLARALHAFGFDRRPPSAVVLAEYDNGVGDAPRRVSWSGIRAGVALANTLAFSWNAPVISMKLTGRPGDRELAAAAWRQAARAVKGDWARAVYGGEPNITKSKKTL